MEFYYADDYYYYGNVMMMNLKTCGTMEFYYYDCDKDEDVNDEKSP